MCPDNKNRKPSTIDYSKRNTSNQYLKGTATPWTDDEREIARNKSLEYWTAERRDALSIQKKQEMVQVMINHPDSYSYKNFCGRSKKSVYNGQLMHSSWELMVAKWFDTNSIKWTRIVPGFKYIWQDTERTYFPDFYLEDMKLYVEVKGYETERDLAKWKSVPGLIIIKSAEIKQILNDTYTFGRVS